MQVRLLSASAWLSFAIVSASASAESTLCTEITPAIAPVTITVPGVYCLKQDQSMPAGFTMGSAIGIYANNVVIDLNGHKLGNLAAGVDTMAEGISATNQANITIRNGIIRGFGSAIRIQSNYPVTVSQGHLVEDILADQNRMSGIDVAGSGMTIRRNKVILTGGSPTNSSNAAGIRAQGPNNNVIDNDVSQVAASFLSQGITFQYFDNGVISGNRISSFGSPSWQGRGISVVLSSRVSITNNIISDAPSQVSTYGILSNSNNNLISGNSINGLTNGVGMVMASDAYANNVVLGATTAYSGGTDLGGNLFH